MHCANRPLPVKHLYAATHNMRTSHKLWLFDDYSLVLNTKENLNHHIERRLEDGREDAFDNILDFLCVLGLVGFHDLFGDIVCRSGNHFAFCHVGKALLVDARIELEINQQTWHLHKLLYTP